MPLKLGTQFNRPVVALMSFVQFQLLQIRIGSSGFKNIYGLHCSYIAQANQTPAASVQDAVQNQSVQGRVAIIAEPMDLSAFSPSDLTGGLLPFQATVSFGNFAPSNILFDESFINNLDIDFSLIPFQITDGTEVSIIMSVGYTPTDNGIVATGTKVGYLNVLGEILTQNSLQYGSPLILR